MYTKANSRQSESTIEQQYTGRECQSGLRWLRGDVWTESLQTMDVVHVSARRRATWRAAGRSSLRGKKKELKKGAPK
jgi:hypothetical protein